MEGYPLTWRRRGQLWLRLGIRLMLTLAGAALLWKLFPPLWSVLAPFVLAFGTAAVLNPLVLWCQRRLGWSRKLLSLLLLVLILVLLGGGLAWLVYAAGVELAELVRNWQGIADQSMALFYQLENLFARVLDLIPNEVAQGVQSLLDQLTAWFQRETSALLSAAAQYATDKAMGAPGFLLALAVFGMATYFLTADYPYLRTRFLQHMSEGAQGVLRLFRSTALAAFGGYLKAQLLLSAGVFGILLAGFLLTGQSYALLLAFALAVLDFIPLLGAGTAMIPWALSAAVMGDWYRGGVLLAIWAVTALFRRLAEPKILGEQTGLSPVLSLLSIYVGMKTAGVLGMILGPVLTLVALNLAGLGVFRGVRDDLSAAACDLAALLSRRAGEEES